MWITLKDSHINFNYVYKYTRIGKEIRIMHMSRESESFMYPTERKAKEVEKYLNKVLNEENIGRNTHNAEQSVKE